VVHCRGRQGIQLPAMPCEGRLVHPPHVPPLRRGGAGNLALPAVRRSPETRGNNVRPKRCAPPPIETYVFRPLDGRLTVLADRRRYRLDTATQGLACDNLLIETVIANGQYARPAQSRTLTFLGGTCWRWEFRRGDLIGISPGRCGRFWRPTYLAAAADRGDVLRLFREFTPDCITSRAWATNAPLE
jgi:hypothetical protein